MLACEGRLTRRYSESVKLECSPSCGARDGSQRYAHPSPRHGAQEVIAGASQSNPNKPNICLGILLLNPFPLELGVLRDRAQLRGGGLTKITESVYYPANRVNREGGLFATQSAERPRQLIIKSLVGGSPDN